MILDTAKAFPVTRPVARGKSRRYAEALELLRPHRASGIYAVTDQAGKVLYVGESHSGRLYDTITRHFRDWSIDPKNDALGRRRGGTTYDRGRVKVCFVVTEPGTAQALQYAEIERLRPRDNSIDGKAVDVIPVGGEEIHENPPRDENERRGRAAMRRVLKSHRDEWDAMDRPGLGTVAFVWKSLARRQKRERGVSRVLARRGAKVAMMMPVVIARGVATEQDSSHEPHRAKIVYRGYVAVLSRHWHGKRPAWLLTGWKEGAPDAIR